MAKNTSNSGQGQPHAAGTTDRGSSPQRDGGSTAGMHDQSQHGAASGHEQHGGRASASGVGNSMHEAGHRAGEVVSDYPMLAVLTGFGLGFGLGFAVAALVSHREEPSWSSRSLTDAFRDLSHSLRNVPHTVADYASSAMHRH